MPRLDRKYTNAEVKHMVTMLRDQTYQLYEQLGLIQVGLAALPPDEQFTDPSTRDALSGLSLVAQNLNIESTVLWRRSR